MLLNPYQWQCQLIADFDPRCGFFFFLSFFLLLAQLQTNANNETLGAWPSWRPWIQIGYLENELVNAASH